MAREREKESGGHTVITYIYIYILAHDFHRSEQTMSRPEDSNTKPSSVAAKYVSLHPMTKYVCLSVYAPPSVSLSLYIYIYI
jgi:hypothetical protein